MDVDVAIVGFGPVGAVAACLLGQAGLRVHVIDKATTIYEKPRAVALDHEIARVLQGIGLSKALEDYAEPFTDSVFYGADGRVIKRLTILPPPHPQGWTPSMVFLQPKLEEALRNRVSEFPDVSVALGRTLTALQQDTEGATLHITSPGGSEICRARYVVGCDGAGSTVRKLSELPLDDLGFDEPWLVVDILANAHGLAKLPKTSVQYCEPSRPMTHVICTGNHRRWEFSLNDGEDPRAMEQPEAVWRLLSRWITPDDAELWRSASYRFHALVARDWRNGRVFIAGDAAHQQPPFLGQGLCQGIRDVANLSWKLAAVIRGVGSDALLDTYGAERAGHVRALTSTIKKIGGLIGERDASRAAMRDEKLIADEGGDVKPVPRQDLMPALSEGFLYSESSHGRGALFPQPWMGSASGVAGSLQRMDDAVARGFRLVVKGQVAPELATAAEKLNCTILRFADGEADGLKDNDGIVSDWLVKNAASYALIRPDHYVFGTASSQSEAAALIADAGHQLHG